MPHEVTEIEVLSTYLRGVMERAGHHARSVNAIALTLAGAIIWRKDDEHPIEVLRREGEMRNALWVTINGQRYVFTYDHSSGQIAMRRGSTQGETVFNFTNETTIIQVRDLFTDL